MTAVNSNIEDLLLRLKDASKTELDHIRRLAEAIRSADTQLLEEVRAVGLMHEIRREAIFGELQHLAGRLCSLPAHHVDSTPLTALDQPVLRDTPVAHDPEPIHTPGDWRQATQRVDEDLDDFFESRAQRH